MNPFVGDYFREEVQIAGLHHHRRVQPHAANIDHQGRYVESLVDLLFQRIPLIDPQVWLKRDLVLLANNLTWGDDQVGWQRGTVIKHRRHRLPSNT